MGNMFVCKSKKIIEDLLVKIDKYQKGIYYDTDEIHRIQKHNKDIEDKTKIQFITIKKALRKLNSNLNPSIELKI